MLLSELESRITVDLGGYRRDLERAERLTRDADTKIARATRGAGAAFTSIRNSVVSLQGALVALGGVAIGAQLKSFADTATQVENRLRLVTDSADELADVQSRLFGIAQSTRTEFSATADLYSRLALASEELGVSQGQLLEFTEGIGQALAVTGASAGQASGALLQLGQAIGGGVVRAEEFNSILEGAPRIAQAAAAGFEDVGISVAELRNRVIEGEISSREFFDAILSELPTLDREFSGTTATIGQALTGLNNAFIRAVGSADDASSATSAVVDAIGNLTAVVSSSAFQGALETAGEALAFLSRNLELVGAGIVGVTAVIAPWTVALGGAVSAAGTAREALE